MARGAEIATTISTACATGLSTNHRPAGTATEAPEPQITAEASFGVAPLPTRKATGCMWQIVQPIGAEAHSRLDVGHGQRQPDGHRRALAERGLEAHAAGVGVDNALADREAEAGARDSLLDGVP